MSSIVNDVNAFLAEIERQNEKKNALIRTDKVFPTWKVSEQEKALLLKTKSR